MRVQRMYLAGDPVAGLYGLQLRENRVHSRRAVFNLIAVIRQSERHY
jgi:hypothetical protein